MKTLTGALVLAASAVQVQAAGTHPVTGEKLANDQTFTYRCHRLVTRALNDRTDR